MSLIERAVKKIGEDAGLAPPRSQPAGGAPAEVHPSGSTAPSGATNSNVAQPAEASTGASQAATVPAAAPILSIMAHAPVARTKAPVKINIPGLRARGFITPDAAPTPVSQQFRVIKRPLLTNAFGRGGTPVPNGRRVMVTSAFPGEGKSFCAINLAISIAAERDHSVLLVDADVAKPSVLTELGIETDAGLMDWLIDGDRDLDDLILPTSIEKLSILPAGRRHDHATEYIASEGMMRLLEQLSTRYPDRIIVFDSPPLLVTTEARELASHMGQIVMVVEAGKTPRSAVKDALAAIEGCEVVGLLLNKAAHVKDGGHYGYGGYGYGAD